MESSLAKSEIYAVGLDNSKEEENKNIDKALNRENKPFKIDL